LEVAEVVAVLPLLVVLDLLCLVALAAVAAPDRPAVLELQVKEMLVAQRRLRLVVVAVVLVV
jgi:hypothetical protein